MVGRADKGLFITTGQFTKDAAHEAVRDGAPAIDLIDGIDLCNLLRSLGLGVSTKTRFRPKPELSDIEGGPTAGQRERMLGCAAAQEEVCPPCANSPIQPGATARNRSRLQGEVAARGAC